MNRIQTVIASLGLISLGALGSLGLQAAAGPHGGPPGEGHPSAGMHGDAGGKGLMALGRAMSKLDLSAEQQQALSDAREDIEARMSEQREAMGDEREDKIQAIIDGTLQRKEVKAQVKERMEAAQETMLFVVDRVFDVYETLDAGQRTELGGLLTEMAERRGERRGRGEGEGPGAGMQRGPQ